MSAVLTLDSKLVLNKGVMDAPDLTDRFTAEDLSKIGRLCIEGYDRDVRSRAAWERRMSAGMDLAMQVSKEKNFPWPGCSNVIFPLVTIASLQFSARSYTNLVQGTDIVRYRVAGEDPSAKLQEQADRIAKHMSWQVLEEDAAWEEQHDRMLINLGIVGTSFIKTYYNSTLGHNVSELVLAKDFVLDYWAKSVETCARKSQRILLYPNEIYERVRREMFRDILNEDWFCSKSRTLQVPTEESKRAGTQPSGNDEDTPFETLEQHRLLDLDQDGYAEPYIVTVEKSSRQVLRIVARWDSENDIERTKDRKLIRIRPTEYYTKYSFIPSPDGGIYDVGFGILLGPLNEAVNSGINQLLDSGTMQNSMGGFLGRGAKIRGGVYTAAPWEWKRVDSTGDDLRKSMVPYPERQPSVVMFQLLNLLIQYTDRISGSTDVMVGENPGQNTPASSYQGMLEQGSQVYNMVFKRVWRSMKEEFKKLHVLNAQYLGASKTFGSIGFKIYAEDYRSNPDMVVPVADPNITSPQQRMQQAQMLREASMQSPGYNRTEVERNFLRALKIEGVDKFFPGPDKVPAPEDPKVTLEKLKQAGKQSDNQFQAQMAMLELMETRRLNNGKIMQLEAQSYNLIASAQTEAGKAQLAAVQTVIDALKAHNDTISERLGMMQGETSGDSGTGKRPVTRQLPRLADEHGDTGIPAVLGQLAGGAQGASDTESDGSR